MQRSTRVAVHSLFFTLAFLFACETEQAPQPPLDDDATALLPFWADPYHPFGPPLFLPKAHPNSTTGLVDLTPYMAASDG